VVQKGVYFTSLLAWLGVFDHTLFELVCKIRSQNQGESIRLGIERDWDKTHICKE
jgi:hypothetical protein